MGKNICELLESYDDVYYSEPATMEQIREAEEQLNVKFADDFIECSLKYHCVLAGNVELLGFTDFKGASIVYCNKLERECESHAHIPADMYIIHDLGFDSILAWQDRSGTVYLTEPWAEPEKVADSLAEYFEIMNEEEE